MYLTRLQLDLRSAQVRRDLGDPYEMHRTLVRAFVRDAQQTPPRILWRSEPVTTWSQPVVLVQANDAADWTVLEAIPHYLKYPVETKAWQPEEMLELNARYRFRLFANPTVTRDGKRQGLVGEEAQLDWLSRQGKRLGFTVETALVTGSELMHGRKGDSRISVLRVCFEGRLQVSDREALVKALCNGVGPGKAFGCGLLSIGRG